MSNNEFSEMAKRLRACCIDYDGSEEADGAPPVIVPSCAELRRAAALLTRHAAGPAPAAPDVAELVRCIEVCAKYMEERDESPRCAADLRKAAALLAKLGQGWVPVSERLPKQGSSVLVLMDGKHHAIADVSQQNPDEPGFFVRGSFWRWDSATHWMPLPPAPGASDE